MHHSIDYYRSRLYAAGSTPLDVLTYLRDQAVGRTMIRLHGNHQSPATSKIIAEEWDILVVLDACRYGALAQTNPFDAVCEKRISQAPNTLPWFYKNFVSVPAEKTNDIIYVTANPKASSENSTPERFYHLEEVFRRHWDDDARTIPPEPVTSEALRWHDRHPEKRLIVHYMQPHGPFIGSDHPHIDADYYKSLKDGDATLEQVISAYLDCVQHILEQVETLVKHCTGDIVITSDHGESFGQDGIYAHPPWAYSKALLEVPWIELDGQGQPLESTMVETEPDDNTPPAVAEQLEHLGYVSD